MCASVALCAAIAAALIAANSFSGGAALASSAPGLLDALPGGASTLVYLDLASIRASAFYQSRPDKGPVTVPNQDYANFIRSTGFDFEKDLDRAVIASWPALSGTDQKRNIAIAAGRFDRAKIRDYAARQGRIDHQRGQEVFVFPTGAQGNWASGFFLDEHRLALVSGQSIDPLFAAHPDNSAADPVRERAARLDGAAAFAIVHVAQVADDPGTGSQQGAPASQLMSMARSVRWITLALRPEGDDLRISLEGECDNGEDARQLQSALEILRVVGRMGLESTKTRRSMNPAALASLQTVLNSAEVTQTAERVRVLVELTPEVFSMGDAGKSQSK